MEKLDWIIRGIKADPGLREENRARQTERGAKAAEKLNATLLTAIDRTGVHDDRLITGRDMAEIADFLGREQNAVLWKRFFDGHGNDNGDVATGYHRVQNDGATL